MSENNMYLGLKELVEKSFKKTNLRANFTYETKDTAFSYVNGEGFILKNENHKFKYPFVEETFHNSFQVMRIMNVLIKKEDDLKKLIDFNYKVENNTIDLFNLFSIKLLEEKMLISYIDYSILINIEDIKCIKFIENELIFQFINSKDITVNTFYYKIYNFDLYVYKNENESYLQEVKIYLTHNIFFTKLVQIINDIIGMQLEKLNEVKKNKIKVIHI